MNLPPNSTITSPNNIHRAGNYYNKLSLSLDDNFYKKIIELENEIQLTPCPSMEKIKELGTLYKKAIEAFSFVSPKKVQFYTNKLTQLLVGADKLTKKQNKVKTKWSQYMDSHKKHTNKFMLFLQLETNKQAVTDIIDSKEKLFEDGNKQVENNLQDQHNRFLERKKNKKIANFSKIKNDVGRSSKIQENDNPRKLSIEDKLRGRNDKVDSSLNDFIKKFHYIYLRSKIFEKPIEKLNEILDELFCHKIEKYYYYQDQIKNFELMLKDNETNEHDESFAYFLKDLKNERKSYNIALENIITQTSEKIKTMCEEVKVDDDKNMQKYLKELMDNISQIFV